MDLQINGAGNLRTLSHMILDELVRICLSWAERAYVVDVGRFILIVQDEVVLFPQPHALDVVNGCPCVQPPLG